MGRIQGAGALSETGSHDEFLELCAVSTSGQLTEAEEQKLQAHLAICAACCETFKQYQAVVDRVVPAMAPDELSDDLNPGPNWSMERAEESLFKQIAREEKLNKAASKNKPLRVGPNALQVFPPSTAATWRNVWQLYAAGIVLFITLGILVYQVGMRRGANAVVTPPILQTKPVPNSGPLEAQISDASHEREMARAEAQQRDRTIADLRRQLEQRSAEIDVLKTAQMNQEQTLERAQATKPIPSRSTVELDEKLTSAQSNIQELQQKLDSLSQQSAQDGERSIELEAKVNDLTRLLHDRESTIDQQEDLLAHDRDIRELMGARDLYIAEVYDVPRTGATHKPHGRLYYTKGKTLIFYAYDLDRQSEVKNASAFQAWGRRGPDRQQALPLGIFFEDNAAKKRWVLKLDNPEVLAQIDAVFVTVEPNGGSRKPSGKPLLFAYLRVDPNHP
jgi:hypothetical protein